MAEAAARALVERDGPAAIREPSDADFARYQVFVKREAGIHLTPVKKALLVGRLARRLRELRLDWRGYLELVKVDEPERVRMLDSIATNETHFFREAAHWEYLAQDLFPRWQAEADAGARQRRVRVWSAACSTGEEPYTLAMVLLASFPAGWRLEIFASDLSTKVLDRARNATWPLEKSAEIPRAYLEAYMLRGTGEQGGLMRAGPELRALCTFRRVNLLSGPFPEGDFDLVFCRNVLIYFDHETKTTVVDHLVNRLARGGRLFIGHAETLAGLCPRVRQLRPTVYGHVGGEGRGGAR